MVHAVELEPGRGAQMARSAGTSAQLTAREGDLVTLRLPSGERRRVRAECRATVGVVGNQSHQNVRWGKAGRKRHLGIRPTVRGTVMNPVDHPHGGGEGKSHAGPGAGYAVGQDHPGLADQEEAQAFGRHDRAPAQERKEALDDAVL